MRPYPYKLNERLAILWSAFLFSLLFSVLLMPAAAQAAVDMRVNAQTDPIEVYVTVTDSSGNFVTDLNESDFQLFENGEPVNDSVITFREPAGTSGQDEVSLAVVFVIDNSGSLDHLTQEVEDSVMSFVRTMQLGDYVGLVKFRAEIIVTDFIMVDPSTTTAIEDAVYQQLNPDDSTSQIFDAMAEAITLAESGPANFDGPKAIVLMSDGYDHYSDTTLEELIQSIESSEIPVFTVGFGSNVEIDTMTQIANAGGTDYIAANDGRALEAIQLEMARLLQNSYLLTYESAIDAGNCDDHELVLTVTVAGIEQPPQETTFNRCGSSNRPPHIQTVSQKSFELGEPVSLAIEASDPDGDPITFSAQGLPPGLSIDTRTGVISGTPTERGSYDVQVAATDGQATSRIAFTAEVSDQNGGGGGAFGPYGLAVLLLLWGASIVVTRRHSN